MSVALLPATPRVRDGRSAFSGQYRKAAERIEVVVLTLEEATERFRAGEIADAKSILALLYASPA